MPICLFDENGALIRCNPAAAALAGVSAEELSGRPCNRHLCGLAEVPEFCPVRNVISTGEPFSHEIRINGHECLVSAAPIRDRYGKILHVLENMIDMSEVNESRRQLEVAMRAAQAADKAKSAFLATMSHELRTPVSALQAMVENMADGVTEPTPTNLESILTQTQRLSDLIAFLLDLSRMEAGAASLNIEKFNFADFLDETIEPLEIADGGHAHDIRVTVPADITMEGDQDRLRQLFTNIIANALKHSADGTTVLVDAHEDENQGTIVTNVVNFGSQIAPSDRLDIFRRFVKGKTGPGTESGGTGLGLSIARWAAQLHGGTVKVVDDTRGADFEIILPKYHIAER